METFYERSDIPCKISFAGATRSLDWKVAPETLDLDKYMPVFFDGLREERDPLLFYAMAGCDDLISMGGAKRILPVIPKLITPIRKALATKRPELMVKTLMKIAAIC